MRAGYHPEVRPELKEIRDYYAKTAGLGKEFMSDFKVAISTMLSVGRRSRPFRDDVYVVRLKRFPYGIYYRVDQETAYVIVVKHLHRDPDYGLDRN
jgi:toxin ParE1/3/4